MGNAPVGCVLACGRVALQRGLCGTHLRLARRRVARGEVTWRQLEQAGQALPPRDSRSAWKGRRKKGD
jgi:hypothetical protein